ncbi:hypothetical protein [Roseomonas sp. BN140053]|uniref:hypothetical protein n=1 Tax=Roseomonas sp. BN140053 TaxID=3391898 RepID=UPI0039ED04D3
MRPLSILAAAILALTASPAEAGTLDNLFSSTLGRISLFRGQGEAAAPAKPVADEALNREREAREIRRRYWEQEKARREARAAGSTNLVASPVQ